MVLKIGFSLPLTETRGENKKMTEQCNNTDSELECPFCHEGTMREDSCGCLTCRKCHRVEGTNCNIKACQGARFSTCS